MTPSSEIVEVVCLLVAWLTLALVNAGMAQGKQRRGWPWFLWSLPLGPLATLILVLRPPYRRSLF